MNEADRIYSIKRLEGCHLQDFKEENITYKMCLEAMRQDGKAIKFVPEKYLTERIYQIACKSYGLLLE